MNNLSIYQFTRQGRVVPAEPGAFVPFMQHLQQGNDYSIDTGEIFEDLKVDLRKDYGANGLQIIIALANIQLSPENPGYQGSVWFMPGRLVSDPSVQPICSVVPILNVCAYTLYGHYLFLRQQNHTRKTGFYG